MGGAGDLIAICGVDGSGKATQTALLARRAEAGGRAVQCVSFPRYGQGFFADLIERYLRGEFAQRATQVSPYLAALPYALDRWQAAPELRRWLGGGALVVSNRYVAANMAHQGAKLHGDSRRRFFAWVSELEYGVLSLPRPRLQVLLEVPVAVAARLARDRAARGGLPAGEDIHERDLSYLEATAEAYRELAEAAPGEWAVVECAPGGRLLTPQQVAEAVWAAVAKVL